MRKPIITTKIREGVLRDKWMQFIIENCVNLVISELERIITSFFEGPELKTTRIQITSFTVISGAIRGS